MHASRPSLKIKTNQKIKIEFYTFSFIKKYRFLMYSYMHSIKNENKKIDVLNIRLCILIQKNKIK